MTVRADHPDQQRSVRVRYGRDTADLTLAAGEQVHLGPDLDEAGRTRSR
jgi:hypothetical protein